MTDEVVAWKAQQRVAMAQQLQLEEESLARLEAAAAANGSADGLARAGGDDDEDESAYDAPGLVKVGEMGKQSDMVCAPPAASLSLLPRLRSFPSAYSPCYGNSKIASA
jgi:hypothetical protein